MLGEFLDYAVKDFDGIEPRAGYVLALPLCQKICRPRLRTSIKHPSARNGRSQASSSLLTANDNDHPEKEMIIGLDLLSVHVIAGGKQLYCRIPRDRESARSREQ